MPLLKCGNLVERIWYFDRRSYGADGGPVGGSPQGLIDTGVGGVHRQGGTEILAAVGTPVVDVPVTMQRQIPTVLRVRPLRASGSVPRQNVGHFSYATVTGEVNCGGSAVAVLQSRAVLCSTVDTILRQLEGDFWVDSAPEVDSHPALLSLWPRTSSTTVACILLVLLVFMDFGCVPDDCRQVGMHTVRSVHNRCFGCTVSLGILDNISMSPLYFADVFSVGTLRQVFFWEPSTTKSSSLSRARGVAGSPGVWTPR